MCESFCILKRENDIFISILKCWFSEMNFGPSTNLQYWTINHDFQWKFQIVWVHWLQFPRWFYHLSQRWYLYRLSKYPFKSQNFTIFYSFRTFIFEILPGRNWWTLFGVNLLRWSALRHGNDAVGSSGRCKNVPWLLSPILPVKLIDIKKKQIHQLLYSFHFLNWWIYLRNVCLVKLSKFV